jgi:hypothetical protein
MPARNAGDLDGVCTMSLLERPTARAITLHQIPRSSGAVIWEGSSPIDGAPIVAIVTWHSRNAKTGDMGQTFILRADMRPTDAVLSGADYSICFNCKHRGDELNPRTCYVEVGKSVNAVHRCYAAGNYPTVSPGDASAMIRGRAVRLGAYGDPAMVPASVWDSLVSRASGYTGYTHQWRTASSHRHLCMASVDSPAEHLEAQAQGWRTFRVRSSAADAMIPGEVVCPASVEGGNRTQCDRCRLCSGNSGRRGLCSGIAIIAH